MKNNGRNSTPISHLQIGKVWEIKRSQFVIFVGPIMFGRALWTIFILFFVLNIFFCLAMAMHYVPNGTGRNP